MATAQPFSHDHANADEAAAEYARRGFRVLLVSGIRPDGRCTCWRDHGGGKVCDAPGKHPCISGWTEKATSDVNQIKRWKFGTSNIGIATGGGLVVLDKDLRNGGDESYNALVSEFGPLPDTLTVATPSGGAHYYFHDPSGTVETRKGFRSGLDLLSDGAFVVVPLSRHRIGGTYQWDGPR